ncbi:glycine--tRNA ligase subunit beta, partial [Pelagibacteraceae bacterium]|nr:glycine--tRNA ligase subunit beta [Pelagibacteraceae bacterium]
MAELFIELFSEEIPTKLQIDARQKIKISLEEKLKATEINFKSSKSFSTPKRLVFLIDGIPEKIEQKKRSIKGPRIDSPEKALEGFLKSNNLNRSDVYKKKLEKGEFYFAEIKTKKINTLNELEVIIPEVLKTYSWKKSMKWSNYDLIWGRPLKSIIALFNKNLVNFSFFHLKSDNITVVGAGSEEKSKKVNSFKVYLNILKSQNIVLDQEKRKSTVINKMNAICDSKRFIKNFGEKLIEEVINLVETPNVILCKFDETYLKIPQEILIVTMQQHQKFFPLFDSTNKKLTNFF